MKKLLLLLALLTGTAFGQAGFRFNDIALDSHGNPIAIAGVRVCTDDSTVTVIPNLGGSGIGNPPSLCTPLATIFQDEALGLPRTNPFTADANGNFSFWVPQGQYVIQLTGAGSYLNYRVTVPSTTGGGGGGTPAAPQFAVQTNNPLGTFAGDADFLWNPTTSPKQVTIGGSLLAGMNVNVSGFQDSRSELQVFASGANGNAFPSNFLCQNTDVGGIGTQGCLNVIAGVTNGGHATAGFFDVETVGASTFAAGVRSQIESNGGTLTDGLSFDAMIPSGTITNYTAFFARGKGTATTGTGFACAGGLFDHCMDAGAADIFDLGGLSGKGMTLRFDGATSGSVSIAVPAIAGTPDTILLPTSSPTNGQVLTAGTPSGGSFQTSWATPSTSGTPSGSAGGDLSGTYPNPTVAKVNATSVPVNSAAHQTLNTTASATGAWKTVPDCSDATHGIGYVQSTDSWDCHSITGGAGGVADPGGNGLMARTALNTSINRTITGTANRLTVSNGDGVAGNPTLDIGANVATLAAAGVSGDLVQSAGNDRTQSDSGIATANVVTAGSNFTSGGLVKAAGANKTLQSANLSGDVTTSGSMVATVVNVNGTSVPTNAAADQIPVTTASAVAAWKSIPLCGDASHALAYDTATHTFSCQAITGASGSVADPGANGVMVRTALNTTTSRTLTGVTNHITIANPDGVSGNPQFDVGTSVVLNGADINSSNQVTVTHLASPLPSGQGGTGNAFFGLSGPAGSIKTYTLPNANTTILTTNALVTIAQGGTGTGSTLTGLVRGNASAMTAAELSGDATTSGSNAVTVTGVNGTTVPTNATANQTLVTTGAAVGAWKSLPLCGDSTHGLGYDTTTHAFTCQLIPGSGGSGLGDPGGNGWVVRTSLNTATNRTFVTADATHISITNLDGTAGNPSFDIGSAVARRGVDVNASDQVTATHLASPLPTIQGGTGSNLSAAAAGRYPKSDGIQHFLTSTLPAAGTGTCTNQVATALNGDAPPTCTTLTSAYLDGSVEKTANKNAASGYAGVDASSHLAPAQMPALTGDVTSSAGAVATTLASRYKIFNCQPGLGDGLNAIPAGTYSLDGCINEFGATYTITAIRCKTSNAGTSTLNAANGAGTGLLTGAITCSNSPFDGAIGTQSGTTTIANRDGVRFTFVSDGVSTSATFVLVGTR